MYTKEILIQYEELYLPRGDGVLLSVGEDNNNWDSRLNILTPSGNVIVSDIPEVYKLYCSNDINDIDKKIIDAAKNLKIIVCPRRFHHHTQVFKVSHYTIDVMYLTIFLNSSVKHIKYKNYRWFAFYIEAD